MVIFKKGIAAEERNKRDIGRLHYNKKTYIAQKERGFGPDVCRYIQEA